MSQSEVFRPKDGPLVLRGNLSDGLHIPMDTFRKSDRPGTQGSYARWGSRSINQFFARNVPHASRVKHLKGLLDVPICTVTDPGMFTQSKSSTPVQFPPNNFDQNKLKAYASLPKIPVSAIAVNAQMHPNMAMNKRIFREKAVPTIGMVPVTDAWERELFALAEALHMDRKPKPPAPDTAKARYSAETGRLIPPPSRAMSRKSSRGRTTPAAYQHIVPQPDMSSMVLQMLCQVLQTDDVNAVQAWLVSAPDSEKAAVLSMIQSALDSNDDYYKRHVDAQEYSGGGDKGGDFLEKLKEQQMEGTILPAIPEAGKPGSAGQVTVDRLNFEPTTIPKNDEDNMDGTYLRYTYSPLGGTRKIPTPMFEETNVQMTGQEAFKPPNIRPPSIRPPSKQEFQENGTFKPLTPAANEPKLRLTQTPKIESERPGEETWSPEKSVAV